MTDKKRTLIACSMMEDELNNILNQTDRSLPVVWMDRGFHNTPKKLKEELQNQINRLQDQDEILLAFGLCGNGTEGIKSENTRLILPKFDDCINLMLCAGERKSRGLTRPDSIYLTHGWTLDRESILQQYESLAEQYDEETCEMIFETMYEHYKTVTVIDTGCFDLEPVLDYAGQAAGLLGLNVETVPGSPRILRQLLAGEWDENFIILEPGTELSFEHFNMS